MRVQVPFLRVGSIEVPPPAYQSEGAVGLDLCAAVAEAVTIEPGERKLIPTGYAVALPDGHEGQVRPRSGLALKHGITLTNSPGTIDPDYRGELGIILQNLGPAPVRLERGERIAQLVFARFEVPEIVETGELSDSGRGTGGFGSTGH